ncbi:FadR/GntR family transcriptional regulator [Amycolatopsis sp. NPDC051371]|jgi:DNA-binding FadR family transcriptional regulator|uniref:FadR/GntR family transcriptional regulator n=1 Tax=Amycolatopsis sp. NPDC051371 TaxID=3155800 RepID=UPI00341906AD
MHPVQPAEKPHEGVARQLRDTILSGRYRPGDRLPIERELCERFQVSRSVVRQALLILDQQGLVRVRSGVGGGPFVTQETLPAAIAAFENLLAVDPSAVAEFARAKVVLEPAVTAMAAKSITEDQIAALEANIAEARAGLERGEDVAALMIDFHSILVNFTANRFLALIVELMGRTLDRLPGMPDWEQTDPGQVLAEHERIVDALRRHDVEEVRRLTAEHVAAIWRREIDSN